MNPPLRKVLTLCLVRQDDQLLLGMKKRGFGAGRWNGFGGKVDQGETIEEATVRELKEESGITALDLHKLGQVDFSFEHKPGEILEVHIFKTTLYDGEAGESEEMRPKWFKITELPFESMWQSDKKWFPLFLNDTKFTGSFLFDDRDSILAYNLREVSEL